MELRAFELHHLLFSVANIEECQSFHDILRMHLYELDSSQQVNLPKSSVLHNKNVRYSIAKQ